MNSTFKLIILILLITNTFFTFFISYDTYGKNIMKEKEDTYKNSKNLIDYKRKLNTLYYTNFIDSYSFSNSEISNINLNNILSINTDILFNISYNCIILDDLSSDNCNALFKEMVDKKTNLVKVIKNIQYSYETQLGTIAFKDTTFDDYNKEIETIVSNLMIEKDFESIQKEYLQSIKNIKDFLEVEYSKTIVE